MRIWSRTSAWCALVVAAAMLSGCTSSGERMTAVSGPPGGAQAATVSVADAKFAFAQMTGAPPEELSTLAERIAEEAAETGLTLVQEGDPSATYIVKGYLSAVGGTSGTVVIYVWDVQTPSGTRIHRIAGQETGGGASGDPWMGVRNETLRSVARETVGRLAAWLRSAPGST